MNREIKFRTWDSLEKIYLHKKGFHDVAFRDNGLCFPYGTGHSTDEYPNRFIIEQFTGLKDKNGKDIYEGDIITHGDTYPKWIVQWCERTSSFRANDYSFNTNQDFSINISGILIIGNIHENPKLLK